MTARGLHRILSGLGGALLLVVGGIISLGTALAAPIAMLLVRARARRKGRAFSRLTSWVAAAAGSSVATAIAMGIIFAGKPAGTFARMEARDDSVRAEHLAHPPAWLSRLAPAAGTPFDPGTTSIMRSRWTHRYFQLLGASAICAAFGSLSGTLGWVATLLLGYAMRKPAVT